MSTRSKREFLKVQVLEVRRLRELIGDHPTMADSYAERERELERELAALPPGEKEARALLSFSGAPVQGSQGIEAGFVARILAPFQDMVTADYAARWMGGVGRRGRLSGLRESRLLLTGLPRGSFGLELVKAEGEELFEEDQLADSIAQVTRLLGASAQGDDEFALALGETSPRVITSLRDFLEALTKGRAELRLESGDFHCELDAVASEAAFGRVAATTTVEEGTTRQGVFRGLMLDHWKFDFACADGSVITGSLSDDIEDAVAVDMNRTFFNQRCVADLSMTTLRFRNGREKSSYILKGLRQAGVSDTWLVAEKPRTDDDR